MNICVYCASSETIDKIYIKSGESFGKAMAEHGHALVFGAGKYGVMGAVARGIRKNGGDAIGIIPRFFDNVDVMFKDCEIIKTDTMRERKQLMEDTSKAFVMMPGGIGTFEEFFEILTLKQLGRHNKPIVVYNVNGYYDPLIKMLKGSISAGFMSEKCLGLFYETDDEAAVFDFIENYTPYQYNKYDFLEVDDEQK